MNEATQIVCPHCDGINRLPTARLAARTTLDDPLRPRPAIQRGPGDQATTLPITRFQKPHGTTVPVTQEDLADIVEVR